MEAIGITRIPQGIDELVPLADVLGVRCGPTWMGLANDLSGELFPLGPADAVEATNRSAQVNLLAWNFVQAAGLDDSIGTGIGTLFDDFLVGLP